MIVNLSEIPNGRFGNSEVGFFEKKENSISLSGYGDSKAEIDFTKNVFSLFQGKKPETKNKILVSLFIYNACKSIINRTKTA